MPASAAEGEDRPVSRSPFEIDLGLDLSLTAAGIALWGGLEVLGDGLAGPPCTAGCDPASLGALDRTVVGNRSASAGTASDVLVSLGMALPFALDLLDVAVSEPEDGFTGLGVDALVLAEALALNLGLNQVVKYAVRRPRPYAYDAGLDEAERGRLDASLSFYSLHASNSFCAATAYSTLFTLRHPGSGWVTPVWIATHALAATTAVLRVQAGQHFWTDVLAGAFLGSAVGFLTTWLHRRPWRAAGEAPAGEQEGLGLGLAPLWLEGGGGLLLELRLPR